MAYSTEVEVAKAIDLHGMKRVVDACLNDRETLVGVNDGLQPVLIGLAAKESCERGGAPVKVANSTHND